MQRQVVFILSTNYAGSHFLALQLGSHSRCASIGETHHVERPAHRRRPLCSHCDDDAGCPIYQGVLEAPVDRVFHKLFENVEACEPAVSTLIDNSKKFDWAAKFIGSPDFSTKFVHLIRDPRALVRRWMLNYDTAAEKRKVRWLTARRCWRNGLSVITGSETNVYLWKWLEQNRRITDFLRRHGLDHRLVTYRDLAADPHWELAALMPWLGLGHEEQQRLYWQFTHHGTVKPQYMKPVKGGYLDQRWRHDLPESSQREVWSHRAIVEYLAELRIDLDDESGLRRASA